jgi:hypothetical protein
LVLLGGSCVVSGCLAGGKRYGCQVAGFCICKPLSRIILRLRTSSIQLCQETYGRARKSPTWRGGAWGYVSWLRDSLSAPNPNADLAVLGNFAACESTAMPQSSLVCAGSNVGHPLHGVSDEHGVTDFHCCKWKIGSAASALCLRKRNIRFNFHQACSLGIY